MTTKRSARRPDRPPPKIDHPAEHEHDKGYGPSHGYGPGHGGPSGPGDVPADRTPQGNGRPPPPRSPEEEESTRPSEKGPWQK